MKGYRKILVIFGGVGSLIGLVLLKAPAIAYQTLGTMISLYFIASGAKQTMEAYKTK
jgi:uncharacterized membrane protein HdeD (DUF308 family)